MGAVCGFVVGIHGPFPDVAEHIVKLIVVGVQMAYWSADDVFVVAIMKFPFAIQFLITIDFQPFLRSGIVTF